jgi:pimeloyl-ACP methyl ester carboxylesterase
MLARCTLVLALAACIGDGAPRTSAPLAIDSGYVETDDGVRLFYRTVGAGSTNVVVPLGHYLEQALMPLAAADRRLVFYDPRARGRSEAGDRARISLDRQVADLDAVRAGLGIDSMALIGWSGLAMETAVYAMRHPERVVRLVQVAPVAARDEPYNPQAYRTRASRTDTAALARVRARRERGDLAADEAAYCRAVRDVTTRASVTDPSLVPPLPDVCRYPNEYPDSLGLVFGPLLSSFRGYDWREGAAALSIPRLVIHGMQDAFPLEGSREWVGPSSNARLLVIDGAGHFPFLEQPAVFFPAVEVFLRGEWPRGAIDGGASR